MMLERLETETNVPGGTDMWQQGRVRLAQVIVVAVFVFYAHGAYAQAGSQAPNAQPNPYRTIENPLTLPEGREMGWVMGVEVDRNNGDVWLFDPCGGGLQDCVESSVPPIVRFDASGRFITSFGSGMFAHSRGVRVGEHAGPPGQGRYHRQVAGHRKPGLRDLRPANAAR